jgi:hypothetical protein
MYGTPAASAGFLRCFDALREAYFGEYADRLILVSGTNTRFVRGWCLEVHDLAVAKYAAGREKDICADGGP